MTFVIVRFRSGIIDNTPLEERSHGVCRLLLRTPTEPLKEGQQASQKYRQMYKTLMVARF